MNEQSLEVDESDAPLRGIAPVDGQPEIQAVGRAAQILNLFSNETPELTVAAVASRIGLNRSTVHRYMASLLASGLVSHADGSAAFVPGELAVQLGAFALGRKSVLDLAERPMRELSDATRMTVVLSVWGPSGPVVAKVYENRSRPVLITVPVGTQLSLDTAQSILYLAFSRDQLTVQRLTGSLPEATNRAIQARIDDSRANGIAMKSFEDGITSIAMPIFGPSGISATLALVHTTAMLPMNADSVDALRLRAAATELTVELGGSPV